MASSVTNESYTTYKNNLNNSLQINYTKLDRDRSSSLGHNKG